MTTLIIAAKTLRGFSSFMSSLYVRHAILRRTKAPMIRFKDDGFEALRTKLRMMSEVQLLQFGREAKRRYLESRKNDKMWRELELAREEWRSRHPKRQH